jgi:glutamate-5-semialdehyde dehydrogenase
LILHEKLEPDVWITVAHSLLEKDVRLRCDPTSLSVLQSASSITSLPNYATHVKTANPETDFETEFLDLILAVHTVPSLSSAIEFINAHSSHHTDAIVTASASNAQVFCQAVDSAGTFVNASTRFADGFRYGFGTEVGISTGRIHARGPVGLEGLVIYKYVLRGSGAEGHIAGEMGVGEGKRPFKHRNLGIDSKPSFDL